MKKDENDLKQSSRENRKKRLKNKLLGGPLKGTDKSILSKPANAWSRKQQFLFQAQHSKHKLPKRKRK